MKNSLLGHNISRHSFVCLIESYASIMDSSGRHDSFRGASVRNTESDCFAK